VCVADSLERLKATEGVLPAHAANRERLAAERTAPTAAPPPDDSAAPDTEDADDWGDQDLTELGRQTKVQALRKLQAEADRAQMDRDVQRGRLVARDAVRKDLTDASAIILGAWETFPDRVAPVLVGIEDQARIRAVLRDEIEQVNQRVAEELAAVGDVDAPSDEP